MTLAALFEFFGRLHPMILHLPIGLLIGLVLLEAVDWRTRTATTRPAQHWLAWAFALSALVAAKSGFVLSYEKGYPTGAVQTHMWLGIATAISGLLLVAADAWRRAGRANSETYFRLTLLATAALIGPTGHIGAGITHGENFLWQPFQPKRATLAAPESSTQTTVTASAAAPTYATVAAILESRCTRCHGAEKTRGRLALHTWQAILDGAADEPVIVPGVPDESELVRRIRVPMEHDDRMPPMDEPQLSGAEVAAIVAWIRAGAPQ